MADRLWLLLFIHYFKMKEVEYIKAQFVIVTGFLALALIFDLSVLNTIAFGFALVVLLFPAIGKLLVKGWFKFAEVLGNINAKILLSIVFYIFLLPMSWIYRLTVKNPLQLKNLGDSVFTERNHKYTARDLENIW